MMILCAVALNSRKSVAKNYENVEEICARVCVHNNLHYHFVLDDMHTYTHTLTHTHMFTGNVLAKFLRQHVRSSCSGKQHTDPPNRNNIDFDVARSNCVYTHIVYVGDGLGDACPCLSVLRFV